MRKVLRSAASVLFALAAVVAGEQAAFANEPTNNTFPGSSSDTWYGTPYVFECGSGGCSFGSGYFGGYLLEISPTGDVDHFLLVCSGNKTISSVSIDITTAADLDLEVYKPNTGFVGGSYGSTTTETVSTSAAGMNALVAKIYGYSGAQSGYHLTFYCAD